MVSFWIELLFVLALGVAVVTGQLLQSGGTCRLVTFIPFTDMRPTSPESRKSTSEIFHYGHGSWPSQEVLGKASFSLMASAEMARRHFNDRDPIVVPELTAKSLQDCTIQIPEDSIYLDSGYSRATTADELLELNRAGTGNVCAVVGPVDPRAAEGVSLVAGSFGIPQIAYATIDQRLNDANEFPTFRRVIPSAEHFAASIAEYIQRDIWKRDYVGLLYDESDFGDALETSLNIASEQYDFGLVEGLMVPGRDASIGEALEKIVQKGYRTVVVATDRPVALEIIARYADKLGMLDGNYFWILSGEAFPPSLEPFLKYEVDSPSDRLLRGSALFTNYDRFVYEGVSHRFLRAWREQDVSVIDHLNSIQPGAASNSPVFVAEKTYFQSETPTEYASFIYDAVMTAGISACKAKLNGSGLRRQSNHAQQILTTEFTGASGPLSFYDSEEKMFQTSRTVDGVLFGMYNIRPMDADDQNLRGYKRLLTSVYSHDNEYSFVSENGKVLRGRGAWAKAGATEFLFSDGTTEALPKRVVSNANYLSKSVQRLGFSLSSMAMLICLGSALWVVAFRESPLVRASQPLFLCILCFGGLLVASSTFFLSFDEEKGVDSERLSALCSAFPWFFFIGYLFMYCALFSKLWTLSQLLKMRRRVSSIQQVLLPFLVIIGCSVVILIIWQVTDPLTWVVRVVNDDPLETYGSCKSEEIVNYLVPLFMVFFAMMLILSMISWKLRHQSDLAESRWILVGILAHIQIFAVGIPIINIVDGVSKDAQYMMYSTLTFIVSTTMVALVIWPRIFVWARDKYFGGAPPKPTVITLGNVGTTRVSGLDPVSDPIRSSSSIDSGVEKSRDPPQFAVIAALNHARRSSQQEESTGKVKSGKDTNEADGIGRFGLSAPSRSEDSDGLLRVEEKPKSSLGGLGMMFAALDKAEGDGLFRPESSKSLDDTSPYETEPRGKEGVLVGSSNNGGGESARVEKTASQRLSDTGNSQKSLTRPPKGGPTGSQRSMGSAKRKNTARLPRDRPTGSQRSMGSNKARKSGPKTSEDNAKRKGSQRSLNSTPAGSLRSMGGASNQSSLRSMGSRRSKGSQISRKSRPSGSQRSICSSSQQGSQRSIASKSECSNNGSHRSERSEDVVPSDSSGDYRLGISPSQSSLASSYSDVLGDLPTGPFGESSGSSGGGDVSSSHNGTDEIHEWSNNLGAMLSSDQGDDIETEHLDTEVEALKDVLKDEGIC